MEVSELYNFLAKFRFMPDKNGYVGVEREHFLVSWRGAPVPRSTEFLKLMQDKRWTYELSACQVESRTRPQRDISTIMLELLENENNGKRIASQMKLVLRNMEVGPETMPLETYPDPRYEKIARAIPHEILRAACRVAGTHLHFGVRDITHAITLYNALIPHIDMLCNIGDHSDGERLRLYKIMAAQWRPIPYAHANHFFSIAKENGFAENPRDCWQLIRISIHGTVEFRMFGASDHCDEILWWIAQIRHLAGDILL